MQKDAHTGIVSGKRPRAAAFFVVVLLVLALDLWSKRALFSDTNPFKDFSAGFFSFTLHQNYGISFNIPIPLWLIVVTTALVLIGILFILIRNKKLPFFAFLGLLFVFGGALGNLYDRLMLGYVRDWMLFFGQSAMNLADLFILLGMLLFLSQSGRKNREPEGLTPDA